MNREMNYMHDYEKIVGEKSNPNEYLGPEEQAQRIKTFSLLETTEIGYDNSINIKW